MKNIFRLLYGVICVLLLFSSCNTPYVEEDILSTINSFLENRYESVSISNIEERYDSALYYYSESFISSDSSLLSEEQFAKGVEYYKDTGYTSTIISLHTESDTETQYTSHVAVLYFTNDHIHDSVVNYVFKFDVTRDNTKYSFASIEIIGNEVLYVPNGEIHVNKGIAHVVDENCDHTDEHDHQH